MVNLFIKGMSHHLKLWHTDQENTLIIQESHKKLLIQKTVGSECWSKEQKNVQIDKE